MGDHLERGLQVVRRACDLDTEGKHHEALPLYREAIASFRNAYNGMTVVVIWGRSGFGIGHKH